MKRAIITIPEQCLIRKLKQCNSITAIKYDPDNHALLIMVDGKQPFYVSAELAAQHLSLPDTATIRSAEKYKGLVALVIEDETLPDNYKHQELTLPLEASLICNQFGFVAYSP